MITLGINSNNDIFLTSQGSICVKQDLEAMGDIYINKSQTNRGELIYNTDKGIDFFNTIFGDPCYPDIYQNQLISELEDTEKTQRISNFISETEKNIFKYSVNCQTDYGQIILIG